MLDKYIYKVLEKIGDIVENLYWFCSNNRQAVTWFGLGFISGILINLIF